MTTINIYTNQERSLLFTRPLISNSQNRMIACSKEVYETNFTMILSISGYNISLTAYTSWLNILFLITKKYLVYSDKSRSRTIETSLIASNQRDVFSTLDGDFVAYCDLVLT